MNEYLNSCVKWDLFRSHRRSKDRLWLRGWTDSLGNVRGQFVKFTICPFSHIVQNAKLLCINEMRQNCFLQSVALDIRKICLVKNIITYILWNDFCGSFYFSVFFDLLNLGYIVFNKILTCIFTCLSWLCIYTYKIYTDFSIFG